MKIYIELVIPLILMLMFIFWRLWFDISRKKILKKYKPELNISREVQNGKNTKGGVFGQTEHGGIGATEPRVEPAPLNSIGPEQPEGGKLFQEAVVSAVGEDSTGTGENSTSPRENSSDVRRRRLFGRRKRK